MLNRFSLLAIISFTLLACSKPLPSDKTQYAGDWQSDNMSLLIQANGRVDYSRHKDGVSTSINGPIKEFNGNDFSVGIGPITTTFIVSEPPFETNGHWQMVVDGVRLTKAQQPD